MASSSDGHIFIGTGLDCENRDDGDDAHEELGEHDTENDIMVPQVGMKFENEKALYDFYKKYSRAVGFPVRRRNSKKDEEGTLRYVTYTCGREGSRPSTTTKYLKPQPTIQTGCRARITTSLEICGKWRINSVQLEHNHRTSPSKSRLFRCNRELTSAVKRRLEVNDVAGIPLHKSFNSTVVEAGGYENLCCVEKDCRNYIEKVRRLRLGEGDAAAILAYFSKMQSKSHGFYFSMDLDDESRLRHVFWADNRSRVAYKEFGDVVTFDTTYLTNKYDMPFAPFVGVNHHGQSTLLGCGLISSEDTGSFVWIFRTWLACMSNVAPAGIITDQDRAMQNAIEVVFPNTKHRWCLWHILKKLPEKFGYHADKASIMAVVHDLVYDSQSIPEFEDGWKLMLERFDLHENDWLNGLFENRARWVPCFLRTSFWAGMSTTQRSESMNAFFDGFVHSKTSLKQFVEQYERALRSKVEKEFHAEFKSFSQMIPCVTMYDLEKQFQSMYTLAKFKEFQQEFTAKMMYCEVVSTYEGSLENLYVVRENVVVNDYLKEKLFRVSFQKDATTVVCSCHLFEFRGIVCRHSIAVLIRIGVKTLPESYILRRWRRDVPRAHSRVTMNYDGLTSTPSQLRYDEMCALFSQAADLVADDEARCRDVVAWVQNLITSSSRLGIGALPNPQLNTRCGDIDPPVNAVINDPKCTRRKGAPKKRRIKGALEKKTKKSKAASSAKKLRESQGNMQNTMASTHGWDNSYGVDMVPIEWMNITIEPLPEHQSNI